MSLHSLPIFVGLDGRPVMLIGSGEAADAKRRLLERAGATIVGEAADAALAIVAGIDAEATAARLKARGILVNVVDRADLCDFTLPAIVERDPVIVAIGTGGVSAGLAAALRQRLETWLPASLGALALSLRDTRPRLRERWPDGDARRRAIAEALAEGGVLDLLDPRGSIDRWLTETPDTQMGVHSVTVRSADPDDLTLRDARALARADRVYHRADIPAAILARARADAARIVGAPPDAPMPGIVVDVAWA